MPKSGWDTQNRVFVTNPIELVPVQPVSGPGSGGKYMTGRADTGWTLKDRLKRGGK